MTSQQQHQPIAANSATGKRLLDTLQNDLRNLSNEAKKKHPHVKEAAESGIVRLRSASSRHEDLRQALISESPELMEPFFMGCDTKIPKMVLLSLTAIQRIVTFEAVSPVAAINLINCLWNLMESGVEELKLLQTVTLLISTNNVVHGDALAKGLALCFRLHFTKNQTTNNTASATVRQIVNVIFDRAQRERKDQEHQNSSLSTQPPAATTPAVNLEELKQGSRYPPKSLSPAAGDAFLLFQDLVQLVNADQPFWLNGLTEMTRTFGLELLESIFTHYPDIFFKHEEFSFLLKERVCPLVIKLFSPNIKYKHQQAGVASQQLSGAHPSNSNQQIQHSAQSSLVSSDKPFYPISMRLLRIVNILTQKFYTMLITESEIFLSLLIKFLDGEKPCWQRAVALEVLHKMCIQPSLLRSFCLFYDMKPHSSKIFRDIVTALGLYIQSQFISPPITPSLLSSLINAASTTTSGSVSAGGASPMMPSNVPNQLSPQPSFLFRGTWIPIVFSLSPGQTRGHYLEQLEKLDVPIIPDGYGLTTAYHCVLELTRCLAVIIEGDVLSLEVTMLSQQQGKAPPSSERTRNKISSLPTMDKETRGLHEALLASSWCGLLASFSLLLESSTDETVTETILKHMEVLTSYYGLYGLTAARENFVIAMCRSSLPAGYNLSLLTFKLPNGSGTSTPESTATSEASLQTARNVSGDYNHSRSSSLDLSTYSTSGNMNILSSNATILQQQLQTSTPNSYLSGASPVESSELRQQVVAVGTALPSGQTPSGTVQGPVMLTAKNLQCMRAVLTVAHCHGRVLDGSWHIVLTTLQHLVWILGLKPSTGGSFKVSRTGTEAGASTSALITTAAMSDLPVLTTLLSRLFESSHYAPLANLLSKVFHFSQELDSTGLVHLVDALCKLSTDSMDIAYSNRDPSLFAVAKLLETGLVNIHRIDIIWRPLTNHLLEVSRHPHQKMREWGAEAVTTLVKAVLTADNSTTKTSEEKYVYLTPLQDLSQNPNADIRQKQLDTCLQILQSRGDALGDGWPQILDIVSAITEAQNENLIRLSFQCLQLIIADFMPSVPSICLILVIDSTAKFGVQQQELNVALTAIGSIWNIADFIFQNQEKIKKSLTELPPSDTAKTRRELPSEMPAFECLWMSLFTKLGELCTDPRPAVRKSASQTLFSTVQTHGSILEHSSWQPVLWKVLFPLLERVKKLSVSASSTKISDVSKSMGMTGSSGSILLHHSRNTAQKQWSETHVLTLSGVSRIFNLKCDQFICSLPDFNKSWRTLLGYVEFGAMSRNAEVSLSALKSFQEVMCPSPVNLDLSLADSKTPVDPATTLRVVAAKDDLYTSAWEVWVKIATTCTRQPGEGDIVDIASINKIQNSEDSSTFSIPSQAFLTSLIQIFPFLFHHIKPKFTTADYAKLSTVLQSALAVPVDVATQAYLMSASSNADNHSQTQLSHQTSNSVVLTPLQEAITFVIETLTGEILGPASVPGENNRLQPLLAPIFNTLLTFVTFTCCPPTYGKVSLASIAKVSYTADWFAIGFVPFGERCLRLVVNLYQQLATLRPIIQDNVLHAIIKALKVPLCLKYGCPSQTTWKLSINSLLAILQVGLPVARLNGNDFATIWAELASTLECFLFPASKPSPTQTLEDQQVDEAFDVKVVELIRDSILPFPNQMPKEFVLQIVSIMNKGSIHSTTNDSPIDTDSTRKLREEFARTCFETLLQFSFLGPKGNPNLFIQSSNKSESNSATNPYALEIGLVNKLAVTSLLQRFKEVVIKYLEDEKLSGKCPLARHRVAEISFVLKALATLVASLKKAPIETVEEGVWDQLIALYPHLVDCTTSNCAQVNRSLREVLHEYKDLLSPPKRFIIAASHDAGQFNNIRQVNNLYNGV